MTYSAWSVVFGEQPSAAKWNILGSNDAHFHSFIGDDIANVIGKGYTERTSDFSPGTTAETKITSLDTTVTIPSGGRRVRVTFQTSAISGVSGVAIARIYDGVFGSGGTQIAQFNCTTTNGGIHLESVETPSSGSKTYTVTIASTAGNPTVGGGATNPCFLLVEAL